MLWGRWLSPQAPLLPLRAAWSAVTIPFDTLRQSGWGTARALDLSAVDRLHVRTQSEADGDFACDFWIQSVTSARGDVLPLQ